MWRVGIVTGALARHQLFQLAHALAARQSDPLLLVFSDGDASELALVVAARSKADWAAKCAFWLLASLPVVAGLLATLERFELLSKRVVGLGVLGIFSGSLALVGLSMAALEAAAVRPRAARAVEKCA